MKEGLLLKQTSSFQRWKRRYFKLRGRTLYYAKDSKVNAEVAVFPWSRLNLRWCSIGVCFGVCWWQKHTTVLQSLIFDEVDLSDASVAETSTKNINNSFTVSKTSSQLVSQNLVNDFLICCLQQVGILVILRQPHSLVCCHSFVHSFIISNRLIAHTYCMSLSLSPRLSLHSVSWCCVQRAGRRWKTGSVLWSLYRNGRLMRSVSSPFTLQNHLKGSVNVHWCL